jgi:hypothetical protein
VHQPPWQQWQQWRVLLLQTAALAAVPQQQQCRLLLLQTAAQAAVPQYCGLLLPVVVRVPWQQWQQWQQWRLLLPVVVRVRLVPCRQGSAEPQRACAQVLHGTIWIELVLWSGLS